MRILVYDYDCEDFQVMDCLSVPEPRVEDDPFQIDDTFRFFEKREIADLISRCPYD